MAKKKPTEPHILGKKSTLLKALAAVEKAQLDWAGDKGVSDVLRVAGWQIQHGLARALTQIAKRKKERREQDPEWEATKKFIRESDTWAAANPGAVMRAEQEDYERRLANGEI